MKQKTLFSSPQNKTDFSKRTKNEISPAQQGSTLKRNFKNIFCRKTWKTRKKDKTSTNTQRSRVAEFNGKTATLAPLIVSN